MFEMHISNIWSMMFHKFKQAQLELRVQSVMLLQVNNYIALTLHKNCGDSLERITLSVAREYGFQIGIFFSLGEYIGIKPVVYPP